MKNSTEFKFNKDIIKMFGELIGLYLFNPAKLLFYYKVLKHQKAAVKKREKIVSEGNPAPAIMIFSITNHCNLKCTGCYNHNQKRSPDDRLSLDRICRLFNEACDLGISIIMMAGGEPFIRMDILKLAARYRQMIFPVFTNGTLLKNNINFLLGNPNILPVLSLEGDKSMTDSRRGEGLYDNTISTASLLKNEKIFFGFSITLTNKNADSILTEDFIKPIIKLGAKIIFFVEYVPNGTEEMDLCLTDSQKQKLIRLQRKFEKKYPALFVSLPGDEEPFGGCLAAGRGFIHVSAGGDVEPCPFAPYSTANINDISLQEALSSSFIRKIRNSHHLLKEAKGGCTLWENREWVEEQRTKCRDVLVYNAACKLQGQIKNP